MKKIVLLLLLPLAVSAQRDNEIYLFDLKMNGDKIVLSNGKNFTDHKGYDNQPKFHPSLPFIYYSSASDSTVNDFWSFNYNTNEKKNISNSAERKFSPTVTPDEKFLSGILLRNSGVQDLIKIPVNGGEPQIIINDLKVGYHSWITGDQLLLFILVNDTLNRLISYDLRNKERRWLADNPGRTIAKIPGEYATSFITKSKTAKWILNSYEHLTGSVKQITEIPALEDMVWLNRDLMLFSEADHILSFNRKTGTWDKVQIEGDISQIKAVSRMAISPDGKKLAVVVSQ